MNDMTAQMLVFDSVAELNDDERQPCEVWTRVMGYHRPVASFNIGKKGEHHERRFFREPGRETVDPAVPKISGLEWGIAEGRKDHARD